MVAGPVYVVLLAIFAFSVVLGQEDGKQLEKLLASKNVGNTLFSAYRTALLTNHNLSSLLEKVSSGVEFNTASFLQCVYDIKTLANNTKLQYVDAAGKPQSGLLFGNLLWFGSVNECRNITDAHYCLSTFTISLFPEAPVTWSACFPANCNSNDTKALLKTIIFPMVHNATNATLTQAGDPICPPKPSYTTGVIVALVISGILLFFCFIGTVVELFIEAHDNYKAGLAKASFHAVNGQDNPFQTEQLSHVDVLPKPLTAGDSVQLLPQTFSKELPILCRLRDFFCDFFLCFSLVRNTKKIFNTDVPSTAITCINGIRVMSITWVILGHTFMSVFQNPFIVDRVQLLKYDSRLLSIMPVINGFYSVDSFFFLSGLLVAYTCMRKMQKSGGKFNWIFFYVHRFFRLTPSYMYVILFSVYLKRFLANGPLYYTQYEDKACSDYWWTNLIYINNFYPTEGGSCVGWTWYLANDMQFFVITPPLLYILYRFGWRALVAPATLIVFSCITIASLYGYYELDPFMVMKSIEGDRSAASKLTEYMKYVYLKPYCRIQPYLVGFILGYAMNMNYSWMRKPGWIITMVGWIVAAVVGMLLVYGPHDYIFPDSTHFNKAENILYGTFERLFWGLVLAWVTYACHYHAGGLVQKFLSAKFWIPLSRLTYSVYLIHLILLPVIFTGAMGTIQYDVTTMAYYFIATVVLSYGAGFILSVCIEFPCDNLENMAVKYITSGFKKA